MSDVRHVLVLPDRDAAEEAAEAVGDRFGLDEEPQLVRDALAGEDDAEDAQWLVVLTDPAERWTRRNWTSSRGSGTAGGKSRRAPLGGVEPGDAGGEGATAGRLRWSRPRG